MQSSRKKHLAPKERWGIVDAPVIPDWEAAHIFLEVARCGSFRAAAQKLRQSVNALRRRVDQFEQELGVPLLLRRVNGVQLTDEGAKIHAAVLQMESASFDLLLARKGSDQQIEGEVGLAVTEGLGTGWVLPQLTGFQRANPKLTVNLRCAQSPPDLLRLEADLSIQLVRPKAPDLKVAKLGRLHMMPFAAKPYLDAHGYPANAVDLAKHRFVVVADDKGQWEDAYHRLFPKFSPHVTIRNNISSTHVAAVANGAGIGFLPTYVQAIGFEFIPLHLGVTIPLDIWLAYRPDAGRIARIRQTIEWVRQIYDPRRFPWFRDEFIHPDRFASLYKDQLFRHPLADIMVQE